MSQQEDVGLRKRPKPSPEYVSWGGMKQRCLNPNFTYYHHYGGRGITVHQPWIDSFKAFHEYMGDKPSTLHTLDRIDNDGNYEPGNVRWATRREQVSNRRPLAKHTTGIKGLTKCRDGYVVRLYMGNTDAYIGFSRDKHLAKAMHLAATRAYEAVLKHQEQYKENE